MVETKNHPPILVAEDEEDDVFFLRRALKAADIPNPLVVASNGREAIQYLKGDAPFVDRHQHPLPGLFLLDLKMPVLGGFDVLGWLQSRAELSHLPVVVLSSSSHELDKHKALQLGAADYRIKPTHSEHLVELVRELHARWLGTAPGKSNSPADTTI